MKLRNKKFTNIYLEALEYGERQHSTKEGITRQQLQKHLEGRGYRFSTKEEKRLLADIGLEAFYIYAQDPSNRKYYLNLEGYSKLLQHREISDARKSSQEARLYAIVAITLSLVAWVTSIFFSMKSLKQKTVIEEGQFKVIESIWHKLETTSTDRHVKFSK